MCLIYCLINVLTTLHFTRMHRVLRVNRPTICTNGVAVAALLYVALRAVMALLTQALHRAKPERHEVAFVRVNVVYYRGRCGDAMLLAHNAPGLYTQLMPAPLAPPTRVIQVIPTRVLA